MLGSSAGYGYLLWLMRDVDDYGGDTVVPAAEAEKIELGALRNAAKVAAAFRWDLDKHHRICERFNPVMAH
jgi:hypothetical protein